MTSTFPGTRARMAHVALALLAFGTSALAQAQRSPPPPPSPDAPMPPARWPARWTFRSDQRGVSRIDTLVPFSDRGSVELGLISGSIKVTAWNRKQVRVLASATDGTVLDFDASNSHVDLGVHSRSSRRMGSATYDVTVPEGTRLTLNSVSGGISATGVHGGIDVSAVSGSIEIHDAAQNVAIESVSGNVTAVSVAGDVKVEAVSGAITISNVAGTVSAENVSGSIALTNARGTRVRANSVSGAVAFAGALNPAGQYDFQTHSGSIVLQLPTGTNAAVSVETYSGSVNNAYPGAVRRPENDPDDARTSFRYTIGRGDTRVSIETFSGRVQISQGNR